MQVDSHSLTAAENQAYANAGSGIDPISLLTHLVLVLVLLLLLLLVGATLLKRLLRLAPPFHIGSGFRPLYILTFFDITFTNYVGFGIGTGRFYSVPGTSLPEEASATSATVTVTEEEVVQCQL